jgi:pimeloyl-ACP methyl ester carboxylesterase
MNDIAELKEYMLLHARVQGMDPAEYHRIADPVRSDEEGDPDSWAARWTAAGAELEDAGKLLEACRCYNLARFPFPDGPAREKALESCVAVFDRWRRASTKLEPLTVDCLGGQVHCWTAGFDPADRRPLVLVMGGQVSIKEQWAPLLPLISSLGFAAVAAEMPGVGQNTVRYTRDSWQMVARILDAASAGADSSRTYAVCLSFSGQLALRCAAQDGRIRGIVAASAPIRRFFTDLEWQSRVPRICVDSLEYLSGAPLAEMADWALDDATLAAVKVPVHYMVSTQDDIVPADEGALLARLAPDVHLMSNNDVHGSPNRLLEARLWVMLSLLRMHGSNRGRRALLATLFKLRRITGRR